MATQPVTRSSTPTPSVSTITATPGYTRPLAIVTTLFFMWGFLTCLNDILVPHLKSIFDLSYAHVMLIQFSFFSAYFLFSIPWARVVNVIGYQRTMVLGLLFMAEGAFLFVPAASSASFPLFLGALIVLAAGITGLQVAANPYVVVLGKPQTASSRLDLTQAFNSLGTAIAPKLGGLLILSAVALTIEERKALSPPALHLYRVQEAASVKLPYIVIGIALLLLAGLISTSKLPTIATAAKGRGEKVNDFSLETSQSCLRRTWNLCRCRCGGLHRQFSGELFRPTGYCGLLRENGGRLRFVLLGWCDGWALSRCGSFAQDQNRTPACNICRLHIVVGHAIHAYSRTLRHVEHFGCRIFQLDYVPQHL